VVLDACISRIERAVPCRRDGGGGSAGGAGAEVAAVVASMVRRVEASAATGAWGERRRPGCTQRRPPAAAASPRHPICAACERGGSWEGEGRTSPRLWRHALHVWWRPSFALRCRVLTPGCGGVFRPACGPAGVAGRAQQASVSAGTQAKSPASLWACAGPCHRSFHRSCQRPGVHGGLCHECTSHRSVTAQ
jgi:hypothetical protein